MNENRTWLSSVLFMDIVEYSTVPVDRQLAVKQHFLAEVAAALESLDADECIKLDTGDGMAVCHLGDPEPVLPVARGLRDAFAVPGAGAPYRYDVRLGLNLGPVKVVTDINAQRNVVGDGINNAQRVMDFADPNQLLVSRSYYEVVSCLSADYAGQFRHLGARIDKHAREHEVYELLGPATGTAAPASTAGAARFDPAMLARIESRFARYVGREQAARALADGSAAATSVKALCDTLIGELADDDAHDFRGYLSHYGYGGY